MIFVMLFSFPQKSSFLSEALFSAESPETLDPLFKFHETIAKVRDHLSTVLRHCYPYKDLAN